MAKDDITEREFDLYRNSVDTKFSDQAKEIDALWKRVNWFFVFLLLNLGAISSDLWFRLQQVKSNTNVSQNQIDRVAKQIMKELKNK